MFGTPGPFFYLPSWHAWDQMVYDALFHVWQLLLTFGWVIYLQQARRPSCESSKRKSRSQCASALQVNGYVIGITVPLAKVTWPNIETLPLYVKEIYSETERIYGYFSSLLYFIFLSLVLFIYILWLLCGRCLISGYWMNERKSSWNRPSDSKAETPRHDMAYTGHLYNLMVAAVLRPHSPDLQPDDDCFLYVGEEIR